MDTIQLIKTNNIPEDYKKNIDRAVEILKNAGCSDIYLFGSLVSGKYKDLSDIDLAVRGCPKGQFFHLLGKLLYKLKYPVDLINLDNQDTFSRYLEREDELIQIG